MRRTVKLRIDYANTGKLQFLQLVLDESKRLINFYIDKLWEFDKLPKFVKYTDFPIDTILSGTIKGCCMQTAIKLVRSQLRNNQSIKHKPIYVRNMLNIDSNQCASFKYRNGLFDFIIKLKAVTSHKKTVFVPTKKHIWFNKYIDEGWTLKNTLKLQKKDNHWYAIVVFEKEKPLQPQGKTIGIDCGYKHLAVTSENQFVGSDLSKYAEKISRKQQGSKAFKRALTERNQYIHQEIKQLNLDGVSTVVVENLKNVKHKTKGRISKQFMNKLQRWNYRYFMGRLANTLEVVGVQLSGVNPAYTSQICSACGHRDPSARNGEEYNCPQCGLRIHADYNAALNIRNRHLGQERNVPVEPRILTITRRS